MRAMPTATLVILLALAGCRSEPETRPIDSRLQDDDGAAPMTWENTGRRIEVDEQTRPVLIAADKAKRAPSLKLTDQEGRRRNWRPSRGQITLVLFWSLDVPVPSEAARDIATWVRKAPFNAPTTAAAKHVRDLAAVYADADVTAVGIVERTGSQMLAPAFAKAKRLGYPIYYDEFDALRQMAKAAGVRVRRELPCLFICDEQQRVRLFKRGFSYSAREIPHRLGGVDERIAENAPPGEHIEDYLTILLGER